MTTRSKAQHAIDVEAVVAHAFRATTAGTFMGLRLGMAREEVLQAIGADGEWREADRHLTWERTAPCALAEDIDAVFRPDARCDLIGATLRFSCREPNAAKPVRALANELRAELGRRFKPIEDKSTFRFVVDGRVNRLWIGSGATKDSTNPFAYVKITLSDPTY